MERAEGVIRGSVMGKVVSALSLCPDEMADIRFGLSFSLTRDEVGFFLSADSGDR